MSEVLSIDLVRKEKMMGQIRQFRKGFIVWLAVLSLILFLKSSFLEARSCERALVKCLDDAFVMKSFAGEFCTKRRNLLH